MTEIFERGDGETKEQTGAHMVDIKFDLPERGVDYFALVGLGKEFANFREAVGDELGVISIAAHIDTQEYVLRVVAHVDGSSGDIETVVGYAAGAVAGCGVTTPYISELTALSQAS